MPELDKIIENIVNQIKAAYDRKDISAGSALHDFTYEFSYDGNSYQLILNLPSYWKYVEYGRGPGKMPPVENIENWMRIKRIPPRPIYKSGMSSSRTKVPTIRQAAYAISKHIGDHGIPARNILRDAISGLDLTPLANTLTEQIMTDINNEIRDL